MNSTKSIAVFLSIFASAALLAQSPFLDTTFANHGRFTYKFTQGFDRFWCTALQADGKILAAGHSQTLSGGQRASLLRIHSNGTVDSSFANKGAWISNDPAFGILNEILVQPDGKILLSGSSLDNYKVVRLNSDGSYDTSFGTGGKVNVPVWSSTGYRLTTDMKLQPNGKILISGGNSNSTMITRIRADGSLDASFGSFGSVIVSKTDFGQHGFVTGFQLNLKSDNKILAAITCIDTVGSFNVYIQQYSISGVKDLSFGQNGVAKIPRAGMVTGTFALPGDDFYILADYYETFTNTALYKFKSNGVLDSSFATNGFGFLPFPYSDPYSSNSNSGYLQDDGKLVVFGGNVEGIGFLGRFDENGFPDQSFGDHGALAPETPYENFYGGFVQPDGKIVAVGRYEDPMAVQYCSLVRYLGSNSVGVIEAPTSFSAPLAYPNPVQGQTVTIAYELPAPSPVEIRLLDLQGRFLGTLQSVALTKGKNEAVLDLPANLTNGIYLLDIQTNKGNAVVKWVLQR